MTNIKNNKGYNKSLHESVHARSLQPPPLTFDAHCKVSDITCSSDVDEKRSYIKLEFAMEKGFYKAIINKDKCGVLEIIVQFDSHVSLLTACKKFNLLRKGFRMEPKKYYRYGKDRVSTKEFKIVNVEKTITNDEIYKAMETIIRRGTIYIRHRKTYETNGLYGDILFTITDDQMAHSLVERWYVTIWEKVYSLAPAFLTEKQLATRQQWTAKFTGLDHTVTTKEIEEVAESINAKCFKLKTNESGLTITMEFKSESDMITACSKKIYYKTFTISGTYDNQLAHEFMRLLRSTHGVGIKNTNKKTEKGVYTIKKQRCDI